jgi:hypothetical protein
MDGKRERGSRGRKGGSKGGSKRAKAEDGAVTKLRATLSEALAILDWPDATEADLETALGQLGPLMHQLLGLTTKKGRSGALDAPMHRKILGAIETGCAHPQPRVCTAAWKAFREVSLLDAELCALAIERGLTARALAQLQPPPGQPPPGQPPPGAVPTERRLCALGVLWNLSEACPISRLYFPFLSPRSPLDLPCISLSECGGT